MNYSPPAVPTSSNKQRRFFTPRVAVAVIIANMIGTGVFTSLGYQLDGITSGFALLMLWALGGLTAFCGALCYAELGARLPRSGGEYNFLSVAIHPSLGFVSGWISATIGFAAPTALVAITFGRYLNLVVPQVPPTLSACVLIIALALLHASSRERSGQTQWIFTVLKVAMVVGGCLAALVFAPLETSTRFAVGTSEAAVLVSTPFAISLIYVSYAYSGWNAATYISGELENPQKSLPRVLAIGTAVVTLIYVLVNYTFLSIAPQEVLVGRLEIVYVAAEYAFGSNVARIASALLSLLLISTASAMIMAAPRVLQMIGEDFKAFAPLSRSNDDGIPYVAIYVQALIALVLVVTATFESILVFSGFTLAVNTFVTVVSLFVLRITQADEPRPFSAWGYPVTPLTFLALTGWTICHIALNRPREALWGAVLIAFGFVVYALVPKQRT
ncbi:MAG: APC family permease [Gammaproteobacteria bacterium]